MDDSVFESIPITLGREEDGRWWADVELMSGVMAYGETREAAIMAVRRWRCESPPTASTTGSRYRSR